MKIAWLLGYKHQGSCWNNSLEDINSFTEDWNNNNSNFFSTFFCTVLFDVFDLEILAIDLWGVFLFVWTLVFMFFVFFF